MGCVVFIVAFLLFSTVTGYPHGAPYSSCISQFPQHDTDPQTDPSPYLLEVSDTTYGPQGNIKVTISGPEFTGFSLTARRVTGDREELLGTFVDFPATHTQVYDCLNGNKNFVTHKTAAAQSNTTFTWTPGQSTAGDIIFRATVLTTDEVFWTWVTSPHIIDTSKFGNLGSEQKVENVLPDMNLENDCGKTKGCFLNPRTCTGSDCTSAVSYQLDDDVIHFEMMGIAEGYVAVGFSDDEYMGDDDVVACTVDGPKVSVQHGFTVGYRYIRQYSNNLTNMATAKRDGKIYCRFSRPMSLSSMRVEEDEEEVFEPEEKKVDLSEGKIMFIATGYIYAGGDDLAEHDEMPVQTTEKVDFGQFKVERGKTMTLMTQMHGVLMVLAWILFASFATVEGRYFRGGFAERKVNGLKLWFQMHRFAAMSAGALTAAGFILIFVKVKGLSKNAQAHAYIGIAVMAATCAQIFLGLIRPDHKAGWRPIFNWLHRILGKVTHILAAVDLILAFRIPLLPPAMRQFGTTVIAVWISVQVVWEISLEINKYLQSKTPKVDPIPDTGKMKIDEKFVKKDPNNRLQFILFVLFVLTITSCTTAALCAIFLF